MKTTVILMVLIFSVICGASFGAETGWRVIFEDDFTNNRNGWSLGDNTEVRTEINNGKYIFEYKRDGGDGGWLIWKNIKIDQTKDFQIELTIKKIHGVKDRDYAIVWGLQEKPLNFYAFGISDDGHYHYGKWVNNQWKEIIKWASSTYVNTGNATNTLSLKKSGNRMLLFINDHYIGEAQFEKFFGNFIGFAIPKKPIKVEIDHLLVQQYFPDPDRSSGANREAKGATSLPLNGSDPEGRLDYNMGDQTDWYQVEMPEIGIFTCYVQQETPGTMLFVEVYYTPQGSQEPAKTLLKTFSVYGKNSQSAIIEDAKPGTYYAKVFLRNEKEVSSYKISNTFQLPLPTPTPTRTPTPKPSPTLIPTFTPSPTPSGYTVTISSNPSGANVFIANTYRGITPVTLTLPTAGTWTLRLEKSGYEARRPNIVLSSDVTRSDYSYDLTPLPSPTPTMTPTFTASPTPSGYAVTISSNPSGANVFIANTYRGITPVTLTLPTTGTWTLRLEKPGYKACQANIFLNSDATRSDYSYDLALLPSPTPTMTPTPSPTPSPLPTSTPVGYAVSISSDPAGATVFLGDTYRGITPLTMTNLAGGRWMLRLEKDGYESLRSSFFLTSNTTNKHNYRLKPLPVATPTPVPTPTPTIQPDEQPRLVMFSEIPVETEEQVIKIEGLAIDDREIEIVKIIGVFPEKSEVVVAARLKEIPETPGSVKFSQSVPLHVGSNAFTIEAIDTAGQRTQQQFTVLRKASLRVTPVIAESSLLPIVKVNIAPNNHSIEIGKTTKILISTQTSRPDLQFTWYLDGPGSFFGEDLTSAGIMYLPPVKLDTGQPMQATITVIVSDHAGHETRDTVTLDFITPESKKDSEP